MASVIRGDDNFDSADVGPSTSAYAVGTYAHVAYYSSTVHNIGDTVAGSSLFSWEGYSSSNQSGGASFTYGGSSESTSSTSFSGTWRGMSAGSITSSRSRFGLAVRIS